MSYNCKEKTTPKLNGRLTMTIPVREEAYTLRHGPLKTGNVLQQLAISISFAPGFITSMFGERASRMIEQMCGRLFHHPGQLHRVIGNWDAWAMGSDDHDNQVIRKQYSQEFLHFSEEPVTGSKTSGLIPYATRVVPQPLSRLARGLRYSQTKCFVANNSHHCKKHMDLYICYAHHYKFPQPHDMQIPASTPCIIDVIQYDTHCAQS